MTRVTVAHSLPLESEADAAAWLRKVSSDSERRAAEVRAAARLLNRALHAARTAARDPLIADVGASRALAVRIGYGTGDQLVDGRWTEARRLPAPPRHGRRDQIDPQERVAAVLGGREEVHPAETMLNRARLDLEQGRVAEAALGLRAAELALEQPPEAAAAPAAEELKAAIDALWKRVHR